MKYGVSYYPEHKTQEELRHDLRLLKESGINTVRMGEFAWCRMEPEEGVYEFDWLKDVVEELGQAGIRTVLCTPTACPPAWLVEKHPDVLYMDNRRIRRPFGGRRDYCYNNETYRNYSVKIASELSGAFAGSPYIAGVQIDNEPAQEGTGRCCCPVCEEKFHSWLEKKYGTIEEFNRKSGAIFWSQEYQDFRQIPIPVNTIEAGASNLIRAYYENPALRLCFERFCSDSQREYQDLQAEAVRKYLKAPVTTNATGLATNSIDYYDSTRGLDRYAFDYYPGLRDAKVDSFPYAFARGVKDGAPFWVLEFMSGGGHRLGGSGRVQPNPGALKQAVLQSLAHGSEMMLHFQFRTYPFGAEQLNYAIVDMDGVPRRRYREMQETAALLKRLEPLESAGFAGEAAVCFDYASHWALRIKPVNDPVFQYVDYCGRLYRLLEEAGVNADVVALNSDWSRYKLVVLPAAMVMSRKTQEQVREYVSRGGTVVATFLTSVKNPDNVGYTDVLPAGLTEVFGSTVEEVEPVFDGNHAAVKLRLDRKESGSLGGSESSQESGSLVRDESGQESGDPVRGESGQESGSLVRGESGQESGDPVSGKSRQESGSLVRGASGQESGDPVSGESGQESGDPVRGESRQEAASLCAGESLCETDCMSGDMSEDRDYCDDMLCQDGIWSELLGGDSEAAGCYQESYKEGGKVVSVHSYGKGHAWYVGTDLPDEAYRRLLTQAASRAGVRRVQVGRDKKVELVARYGTDRDYLFLFNFTAQETIVTLPGGMTDYLTGKELPARTTIERNGTLIAEAPKGLL